MQSKYAHVAIPILPPELAELKKIAAAQGVTVAALCRKALSAYFAANPPFRPAPGALGP
jgi:hypothetical protein